MEENKVTKSGRIAWQICAIVSNPIFENMGEKGSHKDDMLNGLSL